MIFNKSYCFTCEVAGRVPGPGYWLVSRHLRRIARRA